MLHKPLESVFRLERHLLDVAGWMQHHADRLHATYPSRCHAVRFDAVDAMSIAGRLFRNGQQYVGAYEHGIDCPCLYEETIADAFDLFEKACLVGHDRLGIHGGISSGKSSVLHLVHFMLGALAAIYDLPYLSVLFTNRTSRAVRSATDFTTAFDELYGSIAIIHADRRYRLGSFHLLADIFDRKNVTRQTASLKTARLLADQMAMVGLQPIVILDDAHILPRFLQSDERLQFGASVEAIEAAFARIILSTMRPELFWAYDLTMVRRTADYAAINLWYRGERLADTSGRVMSRTEFARSTGLAIDLQHRPTDLRPILAWCDSQAIAGIYVRTGAMERTDRLQAALGSDAECIPCDHRIERSEVSDQCWEAHIRGKQYVVLSAGGFARFHRSLPVSTGLFIDCTKTGGGLINAAAGYDRARSLVVMGDAGFAKTNARVSAHNRFRHSGTVRPEATLSSNNERWYDWFIHQPYPLNIDDEGYHSDL